MPSYVTMIEVYPDYAEDGSMDIELPFSYGCPRLDLMGYRNIKELIIDIRHKLREEYSASIQGVKDDK